MQQSEEHPTWQFHPTKKQVRTIITYFVIALLLIIAYSAITLASRVGKIEVKINYSPSDTQVFLDGSSQNINHSTLYLSKGNYTISAFKDGYIYQEEIVNINQYTPELVGRLIPVGATEEEAYDYLGQLNTDIGLAQQEATEKLENEFPLITYLPYNTLSGSFGITFDFNEDYTEPAININIEEKDDFISINTACETLLNFDPSISVSDYNIIVHNFTNFLENKFTENNETDPKNYLATGFNSVRDEIYIQDGEEKDGYYYTVIEKIIPIEDSEYNDYMPYRVILKKQDDSWTLAGTPTLILTTYNTPGIPSEILNSANYYNNRSEDETTY